MNTSFIPDQGYLMSLKETLNQTCMDLMLFFYCLLVYFSLALGLTDLEMVSLWICLKWLNSFMSGTNSKHEFSSFHEVMGFSIRSHTSFIIELNQCITNKNTQLKKKSLILFKKHACEWECEYCPCDGLVSCPRCGHGCQLCDPVIKSR